MSKYLAAVAITLATSLSAPVMADWTDGEVKYFIGGELGKTWLKVKPEEDISKVFPSVKEDIFDFKYKNPMQYGIRFGAYLDENVRVYVNLNQLSSNESKEYHLAEKDGQNSVNVDIELDSKITNRQLTVSADYLFDIGDDLGIPVKPFIGGTLGVNWAEVKKEAKGGALLRIGKETFSDSGNGEYSKSNAAFAYGIQAGILGQAGDFDIELGYRYLMHKNKFEFEGFGEWKMDKSQTAYFAVSYRF